jgi:hypothetical protein
VGVKRIANVKPRITPILAFPRQRGKEQNSISHTAAPVPYFAHFARYKFLRIRSGQAFAANYLIPNPFTL